MSSVGDRTAGSQHGWVEPEEQSCGISGVRWKRGKREKVIKRGKGKEEKRGRKRRGEKGGRERKGEKQEKEKGGRGKT